MTRTAPTTAAAAGDTGRLSVAAVRRQWTQRLREAGFETPELDARILVGHALGLAHAGLAAAGGRLLSAKESEAIAALVRRRLTHEPVARIVGCKEFWRLPLRVDAATLVPRPETETVVQAALEAVADGGPRDRSLRIADLCTGSGAILLALLTELPNAVGIGTDTSDRALLVARDNARHLRLGRAAFAACEMAAALRGPFDVIVCNPPYIASADIARLAPDVRDFDPREALDGGVDGLRFYRVLAAQAPGLLAVGGALVVELGIGQAEPVADLFAAAGLAPAPPRPDLNGIQRTLVARHRA